MTTAKKTFGDYLIQGMNEALEYTKENEEGSVTHEIKVPEKIESLDGKKEKKASR